MRNEPHASRLEKILLHKIAMQAVLAKKTFPTSTRANIFAFEMANIVFSLFGMAKKQYRLIIKTNKFDAKIGVTLTFSSKNDSKITNGKIIKP